MSDDCGTVLNCRAHEYSDEVISACPSPWSQTHGHRPASRRKAPRLDVVKVVLARVARECAMQPVFAVDASALAAATGVVCRSMR